MMPTVTGPKVLRAWRPLTPGATNTRPEPPNEPISAADPPAEPQENTPAPPSGQPPANEPIPGQGRICPTALPPTLVGQALPPANNHFVPPRFPALVAPAILSPAKGHAPAHPKLPTGAQLP